MMQCVTGGNSVGAMMKLLRSRNESRALGVQGIVVKTYFAVTFKEFKNSVSLSSILLSAKLQNLIIS